jgi:hypothetical protein
MSALPSQVNYNEPLLRLPLNTTNFLAAALPSNGSSFGPGSIAQVDLSTNRGFLDPASLSIRYKVRVESAGSGSTEKAHIVGTPVYTFINKFVCYANSQTIETISNYNTVANLLTNLRLSVAQKMGQQYNLGYVGNTVLPIDNEEIDGRVCEAEADGSKYVDDFYVSAPLYCLLGNSEKLIPLFLLQNMRLEFTFESLANISSNIHATNNKATAYSISNFEVVYNVIDFGAEIQNQIMTENPKILIKTSSYNTSVAPVAEGANGNINLIYNLRYASIKSAFLNFGGTEVGVSANKNMDSYDITTGTGDYSLQIAGMSYPQKSLSCLNNKAGIFNELRRAMGSLFNNNNSMSINTYEFSMKDGDATDIEAPAKFWVGFNLQKLTIESKAFFSGISTQNSPITAIINTGLPTTQAYNAMLIAVYDAIIEIDTQTKQCVIVS